MARLFVYLTTILIAVAAIGCEEATQKVEPAARGQRGESCLARNDCAGGLACINGVCSQNDFDIDAAAKQCDRIDCAEDADCCGDKPRNAPTKCNQKAVKCDSPRLPDCTSGLTCESGSDCGGGDCLGRCAYDSTSCGSDDDCEADICTDGLCSLSFFSCVDDGDCLANTCGSLRCSCDNPEYDPFDPICNDPDCTDLCTLVCLDEQCVPDNSCEEDFECIVIGLEACVSGACVECEDDDGCGEGESCEDGFCESPCSVNEECPLFHACVDGECVEGGCKSDRECILAANNSVFGEDARLAKCLASDADPDIKICKVPCENDGACGSQQVCEDGFCVFIGCESDEECRSYLGLENQMSSEARPYVSQAVCR